MKKLLACAALTLLLLAGLSALDSAAPWRVHTQSAQEDAPAPVRTTVAPIVPVAPENQNDTMHATLYFRYEGTRYLGQEACVLNVPRDSTLEKAVVAALIQGPDARNTALASTFPEGTQVLDAVREGDVVTVTLNQAFLAVPAQAPQDWMGDAYWSQEVLLRRRLALESIVLSLTEDARCRSVQLLIGDENATAQGQRVARSLFYAEESDRTLALEPVTREEDMILTPQAAVVLALECWQAKDYESLYRYLGQNGAPPQGEFVLFAGQNAGTLWQFDVTQGSVSPDGQRATVVTTLRCAGEQGREVTFKGVPVALFREAGNWKLSYQSVKAMMAMEGME